MLKYAGIVPVLKAKIHANQPRIIRTVIRQSHLPRNHPTIPFHSNRIMPFNRPMRECA